MLYDFVIIGGGIVGASTALSLIKQMPDKKILLLEKDGQFGKQQTGNNSGVIHSGVYYKKDSLKAKFCRQGLKDSIDFCLKQNIPFEQCGKLIVASDNKQLQYMQDIFKKCQENKIPAKILNAQQLTNIEPNIKGVGAIFVKSTAIVNYQQITIKMIKKFSSLGGKYLLQEKVTNLVEKNKFIEITSKNNIFYSKYLITCAGIMADKIIKLLNIAVDFKIIPFRGEYYKLNTSHKNIINHLIYPVPNPNLPFLGIHITKTINKEIIIGPNAVLSFKREIDANIDFFDVLKIFLFKGFYKMIIKNFKAGIFEIINSNYKKLYLKEIQKYCASINIKDLKPYPNGVRAQIVYKNGNFADDFVFVKSRRSINVCNAPSPAATSSIPIGKYISNKAIKDFYKL